MDTAALKHHIQQRLHDMDKNPEEQEYRRSGRFNFGINRLYYQHLPSWNRFVTGKKKLVRLIWLQAFLTTFTIVFLSDFTSDQVIWKSLVRSLLGSLIFTLFFTAVAFFSMAAQLNQVQKEARRLVYEELLEKIEEAEVQEVE